MIILALAPDEEALISSFLAHDTGSDRRLCGVAFDTCRSIDVRGNNPEIACCSESLFQPSKVPFSYFKVVPSKAPLDSRGLALRSQLSPRISFSFFQPSSSLSHLCVTSIMQSFFRIPERIPFPMLPCHHCDLKERQNRYVSTVSRISEISMTWLDSTVSEFLDDQDSTMWRWALHIFWNLGRFAGST